MGVVFPDGRYERVVGGLGAPKEFWKVSVEFCCGECKAERQTRIETRILKIIVINREDLILDFFTSSLRKVKTVARRHLLSPVRFLRSFGLLS